MEKCRAYHAGQKYYVEVDIIMDQNIPLRVSHDVSQTLQRKLEGKSCRSPMLRCHRLGARCNRWERWLICYIRCTLQALATSSERLSMWTMTTATTSTKNISLCTRRTRSQKSH